ncbi:hypothetical protein KF728_09760 [Candidatus Obscuribacterales bacterium]|nr:hypothetical protein [Candidatus Obscuribacterales bacterium]
MVSETNSQVKNASLYHRDRLIGHVTNITPEDMFQWSGYIELSSAANDYQVMFDYFNDESREREPEEPDESPLPFDESMLDAWYIEDEDGRREISFPVISAGEVFWRD